MPRIVFRFFVLVIALFPTWPGYAPYAEEALAEGYATRSIRAGLAYPFGTYVSGWRLGAEALGLGATGYGAYEVGR